MDGSTFDAIARLLGACRSRRRAAPLLGGLALSGPFAMAGLRQAAARKKGGKGKRKRKRKARRRCHPEPPTATCAGVDCGETRINNCGQEVRCDCPGGFNCLLNGTCARECTGHSNDCAACGANAFCTNANTEGQTHCVVESTCAEHPVCMTSTSECPRGTQCQPCGIGQGNFCIPVAACSGT